MTLKDFIDAHQRTKRKYLKQSIAKYIGVTEGAVNHWANQTRNPSPRHAIKIQTYTKGLVSLKDSRPDVFGA